MRIVLLCLLALVGGGAMLSCAPSPDQARAAADSAAEGTEQQERPEQRVTVRGKNLYGDGWEHDSDQQAVKVIPVEHVTVKDTLRVNLTVGHVRAAAEHASVGMAMEAPDDEGRLCRIHIDRPVPGPALTDPPILVIGYYDDICTDKAKEGQADKCRACDHVIVCGASPGCPN